MQTGPRSAWERALRLSLVAWRSMGSYDGAWRRSLRCNGRRAESSGWLKQQFPTDRDMRISHEAIYRSLFVQTRGVLKKELTAQLRTRRQMRHAKGGKARRMDRGTYSIWSLSATDPPRPEDRAVPGHWEGDLLTGASDTHIVTLVERHSRFDARQASKEGARRLWLPRSLSTSANCPSSYDAP